MKTIYNPSTDRYIQDTTQNRKRVEEAVKRVFQNVGADYKDTKVARQTREERKSKKQEATFDVGNFFRRATRDEEEKAVEANRQNKRYMYVFQVTMYSEAADGRMTRGSIIRDNKRYVPLNSGYYASKKNIIQKGYTLGSNSFDKMINRFENTSLDRTVMNISSQTDLVIVSDRQAVDDIDENILDEILYDTANECISTTSNIFNIHSEGDKLVSSYTDMSTKLANGCWYSLLMSCFEKQYNRKYKKEKLSIDLIRKICGVTRDGLGMTTNEALGFFKKYQVKLVLFNQLMKKVFEFIPEKTTNLSTKCVYAIISNTHVYYINDEKAIKSLCQKDVSEIFAEPSRQYAVPNTNKCVIVYCKEVEKIMSEIINAQEPICIGTNVSLYSVCKYLMDFGITPQISGNDNLKSVFIYKKVNDKNVLILIQSIQNLIINEKEKECMDLQNYIRANEIKNKTESMIFKKQYMSQYSKSLKKAFNTYARPPLICSFVENLNGEHFGIDRSKCYSSILNRIRYIPVFSVFDTFQKYNGEELSELSWYVVKRENVEASIANIIFDKKVCLLSGHTLIGYLKYYPLNTIQIKEFITPYKYIDNPMYKYISTVYKDDSNVEIMSYIKNIFNTIIGKLGKLRNRKIQMCLTTDKTTCLSLCRQYGTLGKDTFCIKLGDDSKMENYMEDCVFYEDESKEEDVAEDDDDDGLYVFKKESKDVALDNGYNAINFTILDINRLDLFMTAKKVEEMGGKIAAIKTDCLFLEHNAETQNIVDYYKRLHKTWNGYKIEHKVLKITKNILSNYNNEYERLYDKENRDVIRFADEWNINPDEVPNDTLIYGLAGTGKSHLLKAKCEEDTLYITPCNTLAVNIKMEMKQMNRRNCNATTFSRLTGCIDGDLKKEISRFNINKYRYIIFEEIYTYNVQDLTVMKAFKKAHPEKIFFANGGGEQLENVAVKTEEEIEYIDKCIKTMFSNIIELKHNKRLNGTELEKNNAVITDIFVNKMKPIDIIRKHFSDRIISFDDNSCRKNICYTNDTVHLVNLKINKKLNNSYVFNVGDTVIYKGFKNMVLENGFALYKNNGYVITEMNDNTVTLLEPLDNLECVYQMKNLKANFDFNWAVTCHSIQGLTYREPICIFEAGEHYVNKRWFYVCISRVSSFDNLYFCIDKMNSGAFKNLSYKIKNHIESDNLKGFELPKDYRYVDREWVEKTFYQQKGACYHCGCGMKKNWVDERDDEQYSVDRVDNSMGHWYSARQSNIVLSCWKCNFSHVNQRSLAS